MLLFFVSVSSSGPSFFIDTFNTHHHLYTLPIIVCPFSPHWNLTPTCLHPQEEEEEEESVGVSINHCHYVVYVLTDGEILITPCVSLWTQHYRNVLLNLHAHTHNEQSGHHE